MHGVEGGAFAQIVAHDPHIDAVFHAIIHPHAADKRCILADTFNRRGVATCLAAIDDEHAQVLRSIAVDLAVTPAARRRMAVGVVKALQARASFFDQMLMLVRSLDVTQAHRRSVAA